ncbi:MAG: arylesterase [Rhodobacteraceae bacterium]|nr:arylesterase [Paracoccaceae bacterium]
MGAFLKYCVRYGAVAIICNLLFSATQAQAAPKVLLAYGDSLTAGYGLPDGDGLVPQLQAWLRAQGQDVTVINGGVSGDTTAGGKARLDWMLTPDVGAVMVILGGNDMLRGISPADTRANLSDILHRLRDRGLPVLLVPMQAPGNFGADYKTAFDAIYPDLAAETGASVSAPFFAPLLAGGTDPAAMGAVMQEDGIHPNAAGVKIVVDALGPQVLALLAQVK